MRYFRRILSAALSAHGGAGLPHGLGEVDPSVQLAPHASRGQVDRVVRLVHADGGLRVVAYGLHRDAAEHAREPGIRGIEPLYVLHLVQASGIQLDHALDDGLG